jgi:hypothetical protein
LTGLRLCLWREETRFKGADTNGGTEDPAKLFSDIRAWSIDVLRAIEEKKKKKVKRLGFNLFDTRLT